VRFLRFLIAAIVSSLIIVSQATEINEFKNISKMAKRIVIGSKQSAPTSSLSTNAVLVDRPELLVVLASNPNATVVVIHNPKTQVTLVQDPM
jgi:hypothetical protein